MAPAVGVSTLLWTRWTALIIIGLTLPHLLLLTKGIRSGNASIPRTVSHTVLVPSHPLDSECAPDQEAFDGVFQSKTPCFLLVFYLFSRRRWNKYKLRETMKTEGLTSEGRGGRTRQQLFNSKRKVMWEGVASVVSLETPSSLRRKSGRGFGGYVSKEEEWEQNCGL